MRSQRAGQVMGALAVGLALSLALGCSEESVGPKTTDFNEEREALMERIARRKGQKPAAARKPEKAENVVTAALGAVDKQFSYDPTDMRDPFRSFEWERPDRRNDNELRGPLEKFDLAQLDLVAVVWKTNNAKALVQDPSGQSYIIGRGTKIGKNDGRVLDINDNRVVVKETYVDHLGQKSTKDIEMRIRGTEGG